MTWTRRFAAYALAVIVGCAACGWTPAHAIRTLPLDLAELVPMSREELLRLAETQSDFVTAYDNEEQPQAVSADEAEESMYEQYGDDAALLDMQTGYDAEEYAAPAAMEVESAMYATDDPPADAPAADAPAADAAAPAADAPPAAPATPAEPPPPATEPVSVPSPTETPLPVPGESAWTRLNRSRWQVIDLEQQIRNQTRIMNHYLRKPKPVQRGTSRSSGSNYYNEGLKDLKSSRGIVAEPRASFLTQTDARCVICQYIVQQAVGLLSGQPLTEGGHFAAGRRFVPEPDPVFDALTAPAGGAAPAADAAAAPAAAGAAPAADAAAAPAADAAAAPVADAAAAPAAGAAADAAPAAPAADAPAADAAAAFLEEEVAFDNEDEEAEPFEFLELAASVEAVSQLGLETALAAEAESSAALADALTTFLAAADTALEHSAVEALATHYVERRIAHDFAGRRVLRDSERFSRAHARSYDTPPMNTPVQTFPSRLNDHGFEANNLQRATDVLAFRPRQARFTKGEKAKMKAKWDATRATYQQLYTRVYAAFEHLCAKRMPLAYSQYCSDMLADYRYIAQGIQYGDKPASICMNGNWCARDSYIRHAVHAYFVREAGDN